MVLLPAFQCMQIHCKTELCPNEEVLVSAPATRQPLSTPSSDLVLCKFMVPLMCLQSKEVDLVLRASEGSEGSEGWPKAEEFLSVTGPVSDIQDP